MNKNIIDEVYYYVSVDGATQESVAQAFKISLEGLKKHFKKFRDYVEENPNCEYVDLYQKLIAKANQNEADGRKLGSLSPKSGRKPSISDEKIEKILREMKKNDYSIRRASEEFGIPKTTLSDSIKRFNENKKQQQGILGISKAKLLGLMALHFRLSLDNMCKLLGKEVNEANKAFIYNFIIEPTIGNSSLLSAYRYLFNYETVNEPKDISDLAYKKASVFLSKYLTVAKHKSISVKEKNEYLQDKIAELTELDRKFEQISSHYASEITDEDVLIVSRYRVKYALPIRFIARYLNRNKDSFSAREKNLADGNLKYKLGLLNNYQFYTKSDYKFRKDISGSHYAFHYGDGNRLMLSDEAIVNIAMEIINKGYNLDIASLQFEIPKFDLKTNLSRLSIIDSNLHVEVMKCFFNSQLDGESNEKQK